MRNFAVDINLNQLHHEKTSTYALRGDGPDRTDRTDRLLE